MDLYAGTGSFGLECLSRQAKCVYFVENGKSAFKILQKNVEKLKMKKKIFLNQNLILFFVIHLLMIQMWKN